MSASGIVSPPTFAALILTLAVEDVTRGFLGFSTVAGRAKVYVHHSCVHQKYIIFTSPTSTFFLRKLCIIIRCSPLFLQYQKKLQ